MKLQFGSRSEGREGSPMALTHIYASLCAETNEERILLQLLELNPEFLVFTMEGIKGEWLLKKGK